MRSTEGSLRRAIRACIVALLLGSLCCAREPEVELLGRWTGDWSSGQTTGTLEITFSGKKPFGDMTLYDVVLVIGGPTCPSGEDRATGDRSAAFRSDDVHVAVRFAGGAPGTEDNVFRFDGTLAGSRAIDGSYTLSGSSCPACTCGIGTSGIWRAFR